MSLRLRILLTTSALVVGIVGAVLAILGSIVTQQVSSTALQVLERTNSVLGHTINGYQSRLLTDTALLADRPGTKIIHQTDSATISDHLDELAELIDADWLLMTNPDGKVIGASRKAPRNIGQSAASDPGIDKALDKEPWKGMMTNGNAVSVAAANPIVIGEYVQAVLVTAKNVDRDFLGQIAQASDSELAVYGPNGLIAASTSIEQSKLSGSGLQNYQIDGVGYVGASKAMPGSEDASQLRYLALVPESVVSAPFVPLRQALYFLLGIGLLLAVGVGAWLAFSLTRPLDGLVEAAKTLKEGRWPAPFASARRDEIGLLQNVFDDMAAAVHTSRDRLMNMLEIDPLTELWNYRSFRDKFDAALSHWLLEGGTLALAMIDIDQFESFNQSYGAARGDETLKQIAAIVGEEAGTGICARYSGNVFAVAIADVEAMEITSRIRSRIERETKVTVSVGVCGADETTKRADVMLLAAEMATSQAKAGGRNRIREFDGFEFAGTEDDLRAFLQQGSYAAVRALAEAVDAKDEYTRGHSERVAQYAKELAIAKGCEAGFVELVYVTGTLHDVGKIGVPDAVLKKTTRLTDEEFAMIQMHPELGEKIVGQIPQLKDTLPGIRHHHERWDGAGYPDNLVGDDIPLLARILAVVDTYDAMTSDRPYRKGLPPDVAIAEIERGAGSQFDAELAILFVEMWRDKRQLRIAA